MTQAYDGGSQGIPYVVLDGGDADDVAVSSLDANSPLPLPGDMPPPRRATLALQPHRATLAAQP